MLDSLSLAFQSQVGGLRERRSRPLRRAIERRALWMAEDAARDLPNLSLEDALDLVHLYAERSSPQVRDGGAAVARAVCRGFGTSLRSLATLRSTIKTTRPARRLLKDRHPGRSLGS